MLIKKSKTEASSYILYFIFFITGIAALIFETLWFRLASITFGNNVWSSAIVLSSFMGGMAAGNYLAAVFGDRANNPLRLFAYMGLIISFGGVLLVVGFPFLTTSLSAVFTPFAENPLTLNFIRLAISFLLLLLPTAAMGATLPLLVKALSSESTIYGNILGKLYGLNTLGACVGAVATELLLVKAYGVRITGLIAGAMTFIAVMIVLLSPKLNRPHRPTDGTPPDPSTKEPSTFNTLACLLIAVFFSGFILLSLEVLWFRFMSLFIRGTSVAFAIMLSIVLAGIGTGALVVSLSYNHKIKLHRYLPQIALLSGVVSVAVYYFLSNFSALIGNGHYYIEASKIFFLSLFLMFPNAFLSGVIFTLVGELVFRENMGTSRATGYLTMSNTLGSMIGPLVTGFILLPYLGMEKSFFLLSVLYAIVAIFVYRRDQPVTKRYTRYAAAIIFVLAFVFFPFGKMRSYLDSISLRYRNQDGAKTIAIREEQSYTLQYLVKDFLNEPLYYRLLTNGYSMSSTTFHANRYMKFYGYLPAAVHPKLKNVLLISYGVGSTAKALTDNRDIDHIDVVDISKGILESSRIIFASDPGNPLLDDRVKIHIEDGRFYLQTTKQRYDLITSEPPPPKMAGIVNLYTQEYFQLIYDGLNDGGIATYWLPVAQLNEPETKSILKAFQNVFPDCTLWTGSGFEWMMVGTKHLREQVSNHHFSKQWNDAHVAPELHALGFEKPELIGTTFLMDTVDIHEYTKNSQPLTDNYPKRLSDDREDRASNLPRYFRLMDPAITKKRFEKSEFINRIWPRALKESTIAYFEIQNIINHELTASATALAPYPTLYALTSQTDLKSPIYWLFNSDAFRQRIILNHLDKFQENLPLFAYHLGLQAIADHDFAAAYMYFSKFEDLDIFNVYLLCSQGDIEHAQRLIEKNRTYFKTEKGIKSLQFLSEKFDYQFGG